MSSASSRVKAFNSLSAHSCNEGRLSLFSDRYRRYPGASTLTISNVAHSMVVSIRSFQTLFTRLSLHNRDTFILLCSNGQICFNTNSSSRGGNSVLLRSPSGFPALTAGSLQTKTLPAILSINCVMPRFTITNRVHTNNVTSRTHVISLSFRSIALGVVRARGGVDTLLTSPSLLVLIPLG